MPPHKSPGSGAGMQEGWSQAKQRVQKIFWDQHKNAAKGHPNGRAWWAMCEKQVNGTDAMPVGEMIPVSADMLIAADGTMRIYEGQSLMDGDTFPDGSMFVKGWHAPWVPEPKYVQSALASMRGSRFRFEYVQMKKDYEEANRAYYDLANNEAFQKGWDPIPLYAPVPYVIRALKHVGAPPKSPKVPEAALAGDLWLLGFSSEENERLMHILATDNGKLASTPDETSASPLAALGLTQDELEAVREMVAAKKARETKKAATAA